MKETMRKLSGDLTRVLMAGAHLAGADLELAAAREALERLGAKAPVLGAISKMLSAAAGTGPDAVRELLTAATSVAQVRAAQVALAECPPGEPLAPAAAIGTPCNARDLYELRDALTKSGSGREEVVRHGVARRDVADLRLVDAVLQAFGDGYLGEYVTREVAPLLGRALVEPIRARLDLAGGAPHARRLRALVAAEGAAARDVLERALKEGSADMREAALDAIADHVRGVPEFEAPVLELVARERSVGVKRAAVRALGGYGSPASLDALVKALDSERLANAAAEALGRSTSPLVVDCLLEALDEALGNAPAKIKKKKDDPEARRDRVRSLLVALAPHVDPRIGSAVEPLVESYGSLAMGALVNSANAGQLGRLAAYLLGDTVGYFEPALAACVRLGRAGFFERASPALTAPDAMTRAGQQRIELVLEHVWPDADPRWGPFLIEVLDAGKAVTVPLFTALGRLKEKRAVPALFKQLRRTPIDPFLHGQAMIALGMIGDPAAIAPIVECFAGSRDYTLFYAAREGLGALDDPSAVTAVRNVVVQRGITIESSSGSMHALLRWLEIRYPGH